MADGFQVDQPLPDLTVRAADGTPTALAAHLGQQGTFVNFLHGTWCAECVGELHRLQRYRADIEATGAKVVVVTHVSAEPVVGIAFLDTETRAVELTFDGTQWSVHVSQ